MKVQLKNDNIMVFALDRTEEEKTTKTGLIIPEETLEEDQVAQGIVIESNDPEYKAKDVVFFHKVLPVDAQLKYRGSELETFWFIKASDVICKIIE